ncbi:MAG: hypothetical protein QM697_08225 [Lachnospiraceae bacterium]
MCLVHTLLFMFVRSEDLSLAANCLKSLERSTYKTLVIYNQGSLSNKVIEAFVSQYHLDCHIIGDGVNHGTTIGRQKCFEYIWDTMPDTLYISELHLDMFFTHNWEDALVEYLKSHDEPLISCGIVDKNGTLPFLNKTVSLPESEQEYDEFLQSLRTDNIIHGFTNPCIHVSEILKKTGGYHMEFLKGMQCFEDDSMLLGYYYYYGTERGWYPKVNFNSIVYHAVAGQRLTISGSTSVNYDGLVKQYGLMGMKALSTLHSSAWHKRFFSDRYQEGTK